jgi:creatinine amidohydrolase
MSLRLTNDHERKERPMTDPVSATSGTASNGAQPSEPLLLANLTSPQTAALLPGLEMVLLPVGAHEQHGPALPVSTDALTAQVLCALTGTLLRPRVGVLPVIPWGVSWQHQDLPGTITLREETLIALVLDHVASLQRQGVRRVLIVNTHGGNNAALTVAAERAKRELGIPLVAPVYAYTLIANAAREVLGEEAIGHAGGDEASAVLAIRPELVHRSALGSRELDEEIRRRRVLLGAVGGSLPVPMDRLTASGATGDSSNASAEAGSAILAQAASRLQVICEELLDLDLSRL